MSGENVNSSMLPGETLKPRTTEPPKMMCAFNTRYIACLRPAEMVFFAGNRSVGFCQMHVEDVFDDTGETPVSWAHKQEHEQYERALAQTLNDFTEGRKRE